MVVGKVIDLSIEWLIIESVDKYLSDNIKIKSKKICLLDESY